MYVKVRLSKSVSIVRQVMDAEFKKIRQNRLECGVPGFMNGMMSMPGKPTMMMPETALKLLAPNVLIGRIIGKQGKKVNEIKDKSGAKITVSNVYDINTENPERTIIITGRKTTDFPKLEDDFFVADYNCGCRPPYVCMHVGPTCIVRMSCSLLEFLFLEKSAICSSQRFKKGVVYYWSDVRSFSIFQAASTLCPRPRPKFPKSFAFVINKR